MSAPQERGWSQPVICHNISPLARQLLMSFQKAARVGAIQTAYRKKQAASVYARDEGPKVGAIRNLGLLDKEEDTKAVLGTK